MRKLVVSEFVTLDGVMQAPGDPREFERGGWAFKFERGPEGDRFKLEELLASDALLLGRRTYEGFAAAWPGMTDEEGFAEKMNSMAKYVVSSTLESADWNNSTIIAGNVVDSVEELKRAPGQDILVAGSGVLVETLIEHRLVDEYRLMVFPIVLGAGKRLFEGEIETLPLELVESRAVGAGVCVLVYRPVSIQ